MHRFASICTAAVVAIVIVSCAATALWIGAVRGSSPASSHAAALPTACDNLAEAARQLAEHGSGGAGASFGGGFLAAPTASGYDTLKTLLRACDDQLVEDDASLSGHLPPPNELAPPAAD